MKSKVFSFYTLFFKNWKKKLYQQTAKVINKCTKLKNMPIRIISFKIFKEGGQLIQEKHNKHSIKLYVLL